MVKRGSVCSYPFRPPNGRGPWAGVKFIGQAMHTAGLAATCRPITGNYELATDY